MIAMAKCPVRGWPTTARATGPVHAAAEAWPATATGQAELVRDSSPPRKSGRPSLAADNIASKTAAISLPLIATDWRACASRLHRLPIA